MNKLPEIIDYTDAYLRTAEVADWANAWNGLQVENSGVVTKIGAAVDACEAVITEAAEKGVTLLLVHHGLFWGGVQPLVGAPFRKMKTAFKHDMAIYSAHLPLDLHPEIGNNALFAKALGFGECEPFFVSKGAPIGLKTRVVLSRAALRNQLEQVLGGAVHLAPGGPERTACIGIVTGGAGAEVGRAAAEGVDTFITGEGPHHSFTAAEELGVNLFYGGHYATETFGVKALAAHLAQRFGLPWEFIDHPTGL
ncbi:MAG: Nif3-like dinuclear metal center hexameric protein [Verrucomicrobiota bacterium]